MICTVPHVEALSGDECCWLGLARAEALMRQRTVQLTPRSAALRGGAGCSPMVTQARSRCGDAAWFVKAVPWLLVPGSVLECAAVRGLMYKHRLHTWPQACLDHGREYTGVTGR